MSLRLVDWADEEGARFGRSLFGSGAAASTLKPEDVCNLKDEDGIALSDALADHGIELDKVNEAARQLQNAVAYLELHIEQGPVLERRSLPLGVVLGTFGVERHEVRFSGQQYHSGSTPMNAWSDAFIAAARSALAFRDDAARRDDARGTIGFVGVRPVIPTAFNGWCEIPLASLAVLSISASTSAFRTRWSSERVAEEEGVAVQW